VGLDILPEEVPEEPQVDGKKESCILLNQGAVSITYKSNYDIVLF